MAVLGQTEDGKRKWVFTAAIKGRFQRIHRVSGWILMAIMIGVPWINLGGVPLLRLDLPGRRLFALGATFTPHDAFFIVLIGLFLAFGLFFLTSLYGRVWCGYACPQTVFLEELIRPIEALVQGDRAKRMALSKKRWSGEWWVKQLAVWAIYLVLAVALSLFMVGFFEDPRLLWTGRGSDGAYGVTAFFAFFLFLDFAWFREQFCNYLCPYARFQAALTDEQSVQVMYRVGISEPRGTKKDRRENPQTQFGACIDCDKCVVVCPTGIDIRNGYQLECIGCARCIDACDGVMAKANNSPGLIQYTSVDEEAGRRPKLLRPRTAVYGVLLTALVSVFTVMMTGRHAIEANLNRVPGTLYQVDADGWVRNTFFLQVTNNQSGAPTDKAEIQVALVGLEGAELVAPPVALGSTESAKVPVAIRIPPHLAQQRTIPFQLQLTTPFDQVTVGSTFKSGAVEEN
ncbi:cytochrome c oxidase accessory protein CcoG [Myxococcota bacterium]|nr:cytochrome c oxidase accessory protein CcoG [Myxococcota bacterium]